MKTAYCTENRQSEIEAADLALYNLVLQIRFLVDLVHPVAPQSLQIESERLVATFAGFAERLDVARKMIVKAHHSQHG